MDFTYRKLECVGRTFFRVLSRRNSSDTWTLASTIDYDLEDDARRTVQELAEKTPGYIIREVQS